MLTSQPLVAFVATTDPKRAKNFYAKTLGLRLVSEDPFALAFDAGGTMLRVAIVNTLRPAAPRFSAGSCRTSRRQCARCASAA
jgi:catechol 2,3-dioxygenase-like lactoylglutathione lyase family enzyme